MPRFEETVLGIGLRLANRESQACGLKRFRFSRERFFERKAVAHLELL
jgi:hypothetical protein